MLTYRMDLTNFVQGARAGVRVAAGAGLRADFTEFSPDADTLGLWHLHHGGCLGEGTGLEDASGGGHTLVNHGTTAQEDGRRFVRDDGDYMQASFPGQPARSAVTLEAWVRGWAVPADSIAIIAALVSSDQNSCLLVWGGRASKPSESWVEAWAWNWADDFLFLAATWAGTEADALLAAAQAWHVAAVLDASISLLRLYVNGREVGYMEDAPGMFPAADYDLYLGTFPEVSDQYLDAVLDEVRLSGSARYAGTFPASRLVASGTYTGLTFDSGRPGAAWVGLPSGQVLPEGTALTWETRAADATAGAGEPQASWQAYDGTPSSLPRGRHFQWRATLASSPDRLVSPTLESVDALASEAGYNIYHATGASPDLLDHGEPWACTGPGVTQLVGGPLDAPAVHWFSIRPVDGREIESPIAQGEVRLELDSQGQPVPDRPAGVLAVSARPLPGGRARVTWSYRVGRSGVLPQVFRIFGNGGSGDINYATPLGETPCRTSGTFYGWTSDPLTGSGEHQLAVRTITADGVWDEQPAVARVTPDPAAPGEVDNLKAEVAL
jgi:hypothetical protein